MSQVGSKAALGTCESPDKQRWACQWALLWKAGLVPSKCKDMVEEKTEMRAKNRKKRQYIKVSQWAGIRFFQKL